MNMGNLSQDIFPLGRANNEIVIDDTSLDEPAR